MEWIGVLVIALFLAAVLRYGADSRDGRDWRSPPEGVDSRHWDVTARPGTWQQCCSG